MLKRTIALALVVVATQWVGASYAIEGADQARVEEGLVEEANSSQQSEADAPAESSITSSASEVVQSSSDSETEGAVKRDLHAAVAALRLTPAPQPDFDAWPMVRGLALCLAAFCVVVFLLKKLNRGIQPSGGRRLRVLEKLAVSPKSALLLVEVDGITRLVGVGAETITDLGTRSTMRPARITPNSNNQEQQVPTRFEEILSLSTQAEGGAK